MRNTPRLFNRSRRDDCRLQGYQIAKQQGLHVIGTLTVLLMAKQQGLILSVRPLLDEMIQKGRWYSQSVYHSFLRQIGE